MRTAKLFDGACIALKGVGESGWLCNSDGFRWQFVPVRYCAHEERVLVCVCTGMVSAELHRVSTPSSRRFRFHIFRVVYVYLSMDHFV